MPTVNLTLTGQAFASVNDTNVTLTLGGTPLTALLKGVSITAGWTGQLSVARGGTGLGALGTANQLLRVNALGTALEYFTPSYGTGTVTSFAFTDSTGITGSVLNATTTPTLSLSLTSAAVGLGNVENTALSTWAGSGNITTLGTIATGVWQGTIIGKAYGGTGVNIATTALTLGTASSVVGSIVLQNATNANTITIQSGVTSASYSLTLPTAQGGASTYLQNDGAGTLSWATVASGISIGDAIGNSPVTGSVLMAIGGVITQSISYRAQQATPFGTYFGFEAANATPTGVNNSFFGYQAGKANTTATNNTFIGYNAGKAVTGGGNNNNNTCVGSEAGLSLGTSYAKNTVFIGAGAGKNTSYAEGGFVAVGYRAGENFSSSGFSYSSVAIGEFCLATGSTAYRTEASVYIGAFAGYQQNYHTAHNVVIGGYAGYNHDGNYHTWIGEGAGYGVRGFNNTIALGYYAKNTASNQGVLGSNDVNGYISDWYFNGVTHTAPYSVVLHATHGIGTNVAAANMTLSGGAATGTAAGGYVKTTTSVKRASGSTQQVDTDRNVIPGKYVDITGGAATTFGQLALATSSTTSGGEVMYTIEANDGTDFQSLTGVLKYDVVNKAGTLTVTYSDVQNGAGACSAGTLTATVTATASGTNVLFQANAVSSLAETVLRVSFQVINNFGQAIISAA